MKHIIYWTTFAILLMTGCSKPSPAPAPEQIDGYIFFSHDVETKAPLINDKADLAGQTIGVVGFKYSNGTNWNTYAATAPTPNVFYDNNGNIVHSETVTCDKDGDGSYAPLQGWSSSKKYAFFAYYPTTLPLCNADGTTPYSGGLPAVKYTLNDKSLMASAMADVMVANPCTEQYQGDVALSFNHSLAALGVKVINSSEGAVTLNAVIWTLSDIKYKDAVIKLDGTLVPGESFTTKTSAVAFVEEFKVSAATTQDEIGIYPEKLILIPQSENLTLTIKVEYKRDATGQEGSISSSPLTTTLTAGKMHLVHLKFTDTKVEVKQDISEGEWANTHEVPSTFN